MGGFIYGQNTISCVGMLQHIGRFIYLDRTPVHVSPWYVITHRTFYISGHYTYLPGLLGMLPWLQHIATNKSNKTNADLMLDHRQRRWPNIKTASVHCLLFAG